MCSFEVWHAVEVSNCRDDMLATLPGLVGEVLVGFAEISIYHCYFFNLLNFVCRLTEFRYNMN